MVSVPVASAELQLRAESVEAFRLTTSRLFSLNLAVEPLPRYADGPFRLDSASHDGVTVGQAKFPPLACFNLPTAKVPKRVRCFAYFANQRHLVTAEGRDPFHLHANQMVMLSTCQPWKLTFSRPYTITTLAIDRELVKDHLPDHEHFMARRLPFPNNLGKVLTGMVQSAYSIGQAGYFEQSASALAKSFLSVMSLADVGADDGRAVPGLSLELRRMQIKHHLETHYARPDLSIAMVAERLHLSTRYIQMAFADGGQSPAEYLRHCRLEAAARILRDPRRQNISITDIAFGCGFNSSGLFSTQFKKAYARSPRIYRQQACDGQLQAALQPA